MRLKILKIIYITFLILIVLRLFYWQVLMADDLSARAENQHLVSLNLDAPRGYIISHDGFDFASNKPSFLVYGLPKVIDDIDTVSEKVAKVIFDNKYKNNPNSPEDYEQKLEKTFKSKLAGDLYWVVLEKGVDLSIKSKIEELNLVGVGFEQQQLRYYPESSSAAHLLGFVGSDSLGNQTGYFGIEGYYNSELKGVEGLVTEEKDARGLPILIGKFLKKDAVYGHSLILNIDRTVQYLAEKKLKSGIQKYGAKSGSVVIMDPQTGAILAMANYPNYDPNNFLEFPRDYYRNPIVADSYEPGSTFKVLVMAAVLNEGLVKPETKCDICSGPVFISGYAIRTWNNKYQPDIDMTNVIVHSNNTGMVYIGRKLGIDKMYDYIQKFGFGQLTGVDLQDESSPEIRPKEDWKELELATASFGQGIAVTPIQVVRAVAAIANGGKLMEPHVVNSVKVGEKVTQIRPKVVSQPISEQAAKMVTTMMVEAIDKGESKAFKPAGFKIAGKTGTAQIPVEGHYDPDKTVASFVGFAPADNPRFVMLVRYVEPTSSIFGSETAAPTFFEITKELFTYYGIVP